MCRPVVQRRAVISPLKWELGMLPKTSAEGQYLLQLCSEKGDISHEICHLSSRWGIEYEGPLLNEESVVAFVYLGFSHNGVGNHRRFQAGAFTWLGIGFSRFSVNKSVPIFAVGKCLAGLPVKKP